MRRLTLLAALCWGCDDAPRQPPPDAAPPMDASTPDAAPPDAATRDMTPPPPDFGIDAAVIDAGPDAAFPDTWEVLVLLDGEPAADVLVMQGGTEVTQRTDAMGRAWVTLDPNVLDYPVVLASHPRARIRGKTLYPEERPPVILELERFGPDNPDYAFQDPGEPRRRNTTAQCGHCHLTINDGWNTSAHKGAASNPNVLALHRDAASIGAGDQCAACHAPGMNGRLVGRDLSEAEGFARDFGVFCDVCHRVESVDLDDPGPGVAGKLRLHRPSDPGPFTLGAGGLLPLTFGPSHDSPNPRMGGVQRDHFRDGRICGGCHEFAAELDGVDPARWPDGRLPVYTTWSEWEGSVLAEATRCNDCHMPPAPGAANSADLQAFPDAQIGVQAGWPRGAGSVRAHTWSGPRDVRSGMLALAAALFVEHEVVDGEVIARVTLRNQGAGHALPTGEPLRAVLVTVEATCGEAPLAPSGGDALPGWAGAADAQGHDADWAIWSGAEVGQIIRVVRRPGGFHDYAGVGRFGDGGFDAAAKGLPIEEVVGEARIMAVDPDGRVELDGPLPAGDRAYRIDAPTALAGAPGFAFARVMVDAEGRAMVPHYRAVDVQSDNRLLPMQRWTSTHRFRAACPDPIVVARAIHRPFPDAMSRALGVERRDQIMVEVRR